MIPLSSILDIFDVTLTQRTLSRPLSGGMSIGNSLNMYGTLGGLFRDNTDGTIIGLTCRHVLDEVVSVLVTGIQKNVEDAIPEVFPLDRDYIKARFTSQRDLLSKDFVIAPFVTYKPFMPDNYNREYANILYDKTYEEKVYTLQTTNRTAVARGINLFDKPVYQPGFPLFEGVTYNRLISGGNITDTLLVKKPYPYTIGHVKRVIPLTIDTRLTNTVDSGVVAIEKYVSGESMLNGSSYRYIGFDELKTVQFASTQEIDSLNPVTPLFKTGAGTGAIGPNTTNFTLSFHQLYNFTSAEGVNYSNGIEIRLMNHTQSIPLSVLEGDCGSMLWALLSSNIPSASAWKIVGQIFAFNENYPVIGYVARIDEIQKQLNISPWNGEQIVYTPSTPRYFTTFVEVNSGDEETINKMGRTCYRVGNSSSLSASYSRKFNQIPPVTVRSKPSDFLTLDLGYTQSYLSYNNEIITFDN